MNDIKSKPKIQILPIALCVGLLWTVTSFAVGGMYAGALDTMGQEPPSTLPLLRFFWGILSFPTEQIIPQNWDSRVFVVGFYLTGMFWTYLPFWISRMDRPCRGCYESESVPP